MRATRLPVSKRAPDSDSIDELVTVIAGELWQRCARHGRMNWSEVERHLSELVESARSDARRESAGVARTVPQSSR